jgi:hypothetical protein
MHQPSGGAGGAESDIVIRAEALRRLTQRIAEIATRDSAAADRDDHRGLRPGPVVHRGRGRRARAGRPGGQQRRPRPARVSVSSATGIQTARYVNATDGDARVCSRPATAAAHALSRRVDRRDRIDTFRNSAVT